MKKSIRLLTIVLGLIVFFAVTYATDKETQLVGDSWYEVTFQNKKIGYQHRLIEKVKYEGKDAYKITEETLMRFKCDEGSTNETKTTTIGYSDLDFTPLYKIHEQYDGDQKTITVVTISDNKIVIKTTLNELKTECDYIGFEKGVIFGPEVFFLKQKGLLKAGTNVSFKSISLETKSLATETVKIVKEEKITVLDKEIISYLVESEISEMPGIVMSYNIDPDGMFVKGSAGGAVITRSTEVQARDFKETSVISSSIPTNVSIPFTNRIAQLQLIITIDAEYKDFIPQNEYQEVTKKDNGYNVFVKSIPSVAQGTAKIPVKNAAFKKYLDPSLFVQSQDPLIIAKTQEIIKEEKDDLKVTRLIVKWVYDNIQKEKSVIATKSAKETLESKSGDCTEHSVLVCALVRAACLPARIINGFALVGDSFGYHAWNEVYLGKWIPVDATVNRTGIPAAYIKLGEGGKESKEYYEESVTRLFKMLGKTTIKIVSFTDNNKNTMDLSDPKKYTRQDGNSYEDKLLGIKVTKPDKWEFKTEPQKQIIISQQAAAIVINPIDVEDSLTRELFDKSFAGGASAVFTDIKKEDVKETKVNGHPAFECRFAGQSDGITMKGYMIITQGNGKTFIIYFNTLENLFEQFSGDFKNVVENIKF